MCIVQGDILYLFSCFYEYLTIISFKTGRHFKALVELRLMRACQMREWRYSSEY